MPKGIPLPANSELPKRIGRRVGELRYERKLPDDGLHGQVANRFALDINERIDDVFGASTLRTISRALVASKDAQFLVLRVGFVLPEAKQVRTGNLFARGDAAPTYTGLDDEPAARRRCLTAPPGDEAPYSNFPPCEFGAVRAAAAPRAGDPRRAKVLARAPRARATCARAL